MQKRDRPHAVMRLQIEDETVTSLKYHAGRPDLNVKRDNLSRHEGLHLIMAMIGTIGQRLLRVKLAMRCPQPALGNRSRFTDGTDAVDLLALLVKVANGHEEVQFGCGGRDPHAQSERPGDLCLCLKWRSLEAHTSIRCPVAHLCLDLWRMFLQAAGRGIQVEATPLRSCQ